jgi:hypothetical protein
MFQQNRPSEFSKLFIQNSPHCDGRAADAGDEAAWSEAKWSSLRAAFSAVPKRPIPLEPENADDGDPGRDDHLDLRGDAMP